MNAALRPTLSDEGLKNSLVASGLLHLIVLLFLYFGLPHLMPPIPDYHPPVPFEIVTVADLTNTRTDQPKEQAQPTPPPPKPQPKQEETPPMPPKPPEPQPEPKPEPKAEAIKPIVKPKPPDTQKTQQDFTKLLKNLEKPKDTTPQVKTTETKPDSKTTAQAASQAPSLSNRLTISEEDMLRRQIEQCWNPPIGAKDAATLVVQLSIDVNADRIVTNAEIVDKSRYNTDGFFRAAADAARRAVLNPNCSPLQVPPDKYDTWKHINFTFDPRDLL